MSPQSKKAALTIHIDGAARGNPGPAGIGAVLEDSSGKTVKTLAIYLGTATNNVAETCALILALQQALQLGIKKVSVSSDSQLLVRQVEGDYRVRDQALGWLHVLIHQLLGGLDDFKIQHIPRERNRRADKLANQAVTEGLKQAAAAKKRSKTSKLPPSSDQMTLF